MLVKRATESLVQIQINYVNITWRTCEQRLPAAMNVVPMHPSICLHVTAHSSREREGQVKPSLNHSVIIQPWRPCFGLTSYEENKWRNRLSEIANTIRHAAIGFFRDLQLLIHTRKFWIHSISCNYQGYPIFLIWSCCWSPLPCLMV